MGPVEIELTAASVAAAAAGRIVGGEPGAVFGGVSIDTRTLRGGDLFFAIRGERLDGAAFAAAAIGKGAGGVVVPRGWAGAQGSGSDAAALDYRRPAVIEVDDTTAALQALAHAIRRASGTKVVAITGSAGKTTTKEVTGEVLSTRYRVIRNRGNFNNHVGLPLSLIELRQRPEIAVVELGMNHAGEISTLVRVAEPEVRVWTNVGDAHVGFFASVDAIAEAKAEIFEGAGPDALLVANADDRRIMARRARFRGRIVTFGIDGEADVRATAVVDRGVEGTSATVATARGTVEMSTPLVGRVNLQNLLAATATALEFDVPLADIAAKAATLKPASHRGEVVKLRDGIVVIDDSYNANPTATTRALELLASAAAARRVAVIGEMLELGDKADALHAEVGRAAARANVDLLVAVGGAPARTLAAAAIAEGMPTGRVQYFAKSEEAAPAIAEALEGGDVVLVKGSRGVNTDVVVDRLKRVWGG